MLTEFLDAVVHQFIQGGRALVSLFFITCDKIIINSGLFVTVHIIRHVYSLG